MTAPTPPPVFASAVARFEDAVAAVARSMAVYGTVYDPSLTYEADAAREALYVLAADRDAWRKRAGDAEAAYMRRHPGEYPPDGHCAMCHADVPPGEVACRECTEYALDVATPYAPKEAPDAAR